MGTTTYTLKVYFPDGTPANGVKITGINKDAWAESAKYWMGTTLFDGSLTWKHIDTGVNGDKYDFYCKYIDPNGVTWKGEASDRIFTSLNEIVKEIILYQPPLDEDLDFTLPQLVEANILKTESGKELIAAIGEMRLALKQGMSHSALALSTYIIEGLIIIKAKEIKMWKNQWEEYTFGKLINDPEIQKFIPTEEQDKLFALNKLRIPSVHFKGASSIIEEAKIGKMIILKLAEKWFSYTNIKEVNNGPNSNTSDA